LSIYRLGVLGGTFNPIHLGHLHIARSVKEIFSLSEVLFVVAATPPHKPQESLIELTHRYAMVSLATAGEPSFVPSLVELEPDASPYSVDTMQKIARHSGQDAGEIYFIAGGDSLRDVKSWRESERLLTSYNFIFVLRPGVDTVQLADFLPESARKRVRDCTGLDRAQTRRRIDEDRSGGNRLFVADIDALDISATGIRQQAALGKNFSDSVPAPVWEYIKKLQLYGVTR
jgi:nicotinate-nucleotide adenylyltransferase